jgi:hypothetical protein
MLIIFNHHCSIDNVVPLEQSENIRDAIIARNGTVKLDVFEVKGHGFSQVGQNSPNST